jgi:glycosyltransferase involved in cell wall biosynthesis
MVNWASIDGFEEKWDLVTTGSEQWRQKINQHFTDEPDILRVPFGLDTHEFQPRTGARESFLSSIGRSPDTLVIGFAGKKSSDEGERKGMDRLFEIVQTLQTTLNRPILVRMIGKEWQVDDIPAPLRDIVHLEGFIAKSQLSHFYAGLDFYICTSWVEGVPYPVLEAMSCGAIALSTPVGVVPELIRSWENGVILNHESLVEDAVNSITKLSATPALAEQVRAAAREDVISKFDWQNVNVPQKLNAIFVAAQTHHANRSKQDLAKRFLLSIAAPIKHELMMQGRRRAT